MRATTAALFNPATGWVRLCICLALTGLVIGCAVTPKPAPPVEAPATPTFESLMSDAGRARQEGSRNKERDIYRSAAAAYPTRKEAWAKLADSYFEAKDYGNAILSAQEVIQRDASDPVAQSILAVSGLRVSTGAIAELRRQKILNPDTRSQAEEIVGNLREVLGQDVLIPKPAESPTADSAATRPRPTPVRSPAPVAAIPSTPPRPVTPSASPPKGPIKPAAGTAPSKPSGATPKPAAPSPFDQLR
jgi:hypothetical protein